MRKLFPILFSLLLLAIISTNAFSSPTAKFTAKVLDENALPIKGAQVTLSFSGAKRGDGGGLTSFGKKGLSDNDGLFTDSAETLPLVGVVIDKSGYYRSIEKYEFKSRSLLLNRWEPWNPTIEVVLKKKRNPVGMYVGGGIIQVPKFDEPIGYDLEKGDWVAPYGKGMTSDFVFTYKAEMRAYRDYECSFVLSFSNMEDGIQEYRFNPEDQSYYKWPFEAPTSGYDKTLSRHEVKAPEKNLQTDAKKEINYIIRVRTRTDDKGNIIEAKYGKLSGEFGFDPKGNIQFYYYFNPDGTQNLEEDPEKNLFKKK
jgi:hypothetical protein